MLLMACPGFGAPSAVSGWPRKTLLFTQERYMLTRAAAQCHCTAAPSPQSVLLDWQRWRSPADDFIHVISPPPMSRELL